MTEYVLALGLVVLALLAAAQVYQASLVQYWDGLKTCFSLPTP